MAILLGNLCADPEVRVTPDGVRVATLRVATHQFGSKDEQGKRREYREFHQVVACGRLAEIASDYLRKGRPVYVQGRIKHSVWEGQDGQTRYRSEVVAEALQLLGAKETTPGQPNA